MLDRLSPPFESRSNWRIGCDVDLARLACQVFCGGVTWPLLVASCNADYKAHCRCSGALGASNVVSLCFCWHLSPTSRCNNDCHSSDASYLRARTGRGSPNEAPASRVSCEIVPGSARANVACGCRGGRKTMMTGGSSLAHTRRVHTGEDAQGLQGV